MSDTITFPAEESGTAKLLRAAIAHEAEKFYLWNQNAGCIGNAPLLWREGGCGYTDDLDEAKLFTRTEAEGIIRSTRGSHTWRMISEQEAKAATRLVIDVERLPKQD